MDMTKPRQRLHVETLAGVTIASLQDDRIVAEDVINEVGDQLDRLVAKGHKKLLLNFGRVQALSSTAMGRLIALRKKVAAAGGTLKLCCVHPELLDLFRLFGNKQTGTLFEIHEDEQTALSAF
jgi:anti-sigma B factor antagonist